MAPKHRNNTTTPAAAPASAAQPSASVPSAAGKPQPAASKSSSSSSGSPYDIQEVVNTVWRRYVDGTPQRTKLLDAFMGFLVVVGVLQFVYCVIAGNYVSDDELEMLELYTRVERRESAGTY
jgi:oligosaccharyltransferase complex subunit epsilon